MRYLIGMVLLVLLTPSASTPQEFSLAQFPLPTSKSDATIVCSADTRYSGRFASNPHWVDNVRLPIVKDPYGIVDSSGLAYLGGNRVAIENEISKWRDSGQLLDEMPLLENPAGVWVLPVNPEDQISKTNSSTKASLAVSAQYALRYFRGKTGSSQEARAEVKQLFAKHNCQPDIIDEIDVADFSGRASPMGIDTLRRITGAVASRGEPQLIIDYDENGKIVVRALNLAEVKFDAKLFDYIGESSNCRKIFQKRDLLCEGAPLKEEVFRQYIALTKRDPEKELGQVIAVLTLIDFIVNKATDAAILLIEEKSKFAAIAAKQDTLTLLEARQRLFDEEVAVAEKEHNEVKALMPFLESGKKEDAPTMLDWSNLVEAERKLEEAVVRQKKNQEQIDKVKDDIDRLKGVDAKSDPDAAPEPVDVPEPALTPGNAQEIFEAEIWPRYLSTLAEQVKECAGEPKDEESPASPSPHTPEEEAFGGKCDAVALDVELRTVTGEVGSPLSGLNDAAESDVLLGVSSPSEMFSDFPDFSQCAPLAPTCSVSEKKASLDTWAKSHGFDEGMHEFCASVGKAACRNLKNSVGIYDDLFEEVASFLPPCGRLDDDCGAHLGDNPRSTLSDSNSFEAAFERELSDYKGGNITRAWVLRHSDKEFTVTFSVEKEPDRDDFRIFDFIISGARLRSGLLLNAIVAKEWIVESPTLQVMSTAAENQNANPYEGVSPSLGRLVFESH
ncbi:MAG: hypothetical protein KDK26_14655 [Roseivivax sp.]|nr:hypothetical protein [Roseivivax sp.]